MKTFMREHHRCEARFASPSHSTGILRRKESTGSSLSILAFLNILTGFWIITCVGDTGIDLRWSIQAGNESCLHYHAEYNTFRQTCDIDWAKQGYTRNTFISLDAYETFDGGSHVIFLEGISDFNGLFTTDGELVESFEESTSD